MTKRLVTDIYTADPSAHVFGGKLYIYPSHDIGRDKEDDGSGDHFLMEDFHVFSMDSLDGPIIDHGEALHMRDVPWVSEHMWAPDANTKNGKYYFYFGARDLDGIFRIGVAVGDNPEGPFKPLDNYIAGTYSMDPCVYIDDDGQAYLYAGGLWGGQLEKWQTGEFVDNNVGGRPGADGPQGDQPALTPWVAKLGDDMISLATKPVHIEINDENGNPIKAGDKDRRFFEASWLHKFNGKYYFSYSTGESCFICYAEGDSPMGPFTYKGRVLNPVEGWTTHHSIVQFEGKWYLFFHDAKLSGVTQRRNMMFTELDIAPDGTITTVNPYEGETN